MKLIQLHNMYQGSPLFPIFRALSLSLHRHFLCCPRSPAHNPSSQTSVSFVPALHLLPTSTPFWPYDTHPFFPHAQTISILSDLLYAPTPFQFQLSYAAFNDQLIQESILYPQLNDSRSTKLHVQYRANLYCLCTKSCPLGNAFLFDIDFE